MYLIKKLLCAVITLVVSVSLINTTPAASETDKASNGELPVLKYAEETITLDKAQALALSGNPELKSYLLETEARDGQALQAGVFPNPEIEFEVEDFWGNKELEGFDSSATTLTVSQLIELGGKRSKRTRAAELERDLAQWDYEAKKRDILAEVTKAFNEALAGQERLVLAEEISLLSEKSLSIVIAKVQAGKVPPIEEVKAQAELSLSRIEAEKVKYSLDAARKRLAALMGTSHMYSKAEGTLELDPVRPSFDDFTKHTDNNPDIARWSNEIEHQKALLNLAESGRIPDPTLSAGMRKFNETEERVYTFGVSFPLPLFDTNKGGILEAKKRISKAEEEQKSARLKIHSALADAYQALSGAFAEATALKNTVLPALENTFSAVSEGYRYGKFAYLDVLDAQRRLFESKNRYIEALAAYKKAQADINRLTVVDIAVPESKN